MGKSFLDTFCLSHQTCCTQQLVIKIEKNLIFWEVKKYHHLFKKLFKKWLLECPDNPSKKSCARKNQSNIKTVQLLGILKKLKKISSDSVQLVLKKNMSLLAKHRLSFFLWSFQFCVQQFKDFEKLTSSMFFELKWR